MDIIIDGQTNQTNQSFLDRVSIALFAFLQQAGLRCSFGRDENDMFAYAFQVVDLTSQGIPFSLGFSIKLKDITNLEDNEEAIEKYCYVMTLKVGGAMFQDKCTRLLQYNAQSTPSGKIIIPKAEQPKL